LDEVKQSFGSIEAYFADGLGIDGTPKAGQLWKSRFSAPISAGPPPLWLGASEAEHNAMAPRR
jgi:hypothetical protein